MQPLQRLPAIIAAYATQLHIIIIIMLPNAAAHEPRPQALLKNK
jgi:hypothetical protein